jgi:DNA-sulfur modification-associated
MTTMKTVTNRRIPSEVDPIFTLENIVPIHRGGVISKFSTSITVGLVADLLQKNNIWVDYDYQRGVKVTYRKDGTEQRRPMVDRSRVSEIADKILNNKLHGGSLVWNLRAGEVDYEYDPKERALHILRGKPTIPDSNHRHQAADKVMRLVQDRGMAFDLNAYEFPLTIEVLDLPGEKDLFYEYNQLGKPSNPTRSNWLNEAKIHNRMISRIIENPDSVLHNNVEVVTNSVSGNSTRITTFNVLATAARDAFPELDESTSAETESFLFDYLNYLAKVRREVGYLPLSSRRAVRNQSIGDSGLAFYAYIALAGELIHRADWQTYVDPLGEPYQYVDPDSGEAKVIEDLMDRQNPLWAGKIIIQNPSGKLSLVNRISSRTFLVQVLRQRVGLMEPNQDEDNDDLKPTVFHLKDGVATEPNQDEDNDDLKDDDA